MNGLSSTSTKSRQLLGSLAATNGSNSKQQQQADMFIAQRRSFNEHQSHDQQHQQQHQFSSPQQMKYNSKPNGQDNTSDTKGRLNRMSVGADNKDGSKSQADLSFKTPPDFFTKKKLLNAGGSGSSSKPPSQTMLGSNKSEIKLGNSGSMVSSQNDYGKKVPPSPLISSHPRGNANSVLLPKLNAPPNSQGNRHSFDDFGSSQRQDEWNHETATVDRRSSKLQQQAQSPQIESNSAVIEGKYFIPTKASVKTSPRFNLVKYTSNASNPNGNSNNRTPIQQHQTSTSPISTNNSLTTPTDDAKKIAANSSYPTKLIRPLVTPDKPETSQLNQSSDLNQIKSFEVRLKNIKDISDPNIVNQQRIKQEQSGAQFFSPQLQKQAPQSGSQMRQSPSVMSSSNQRSSSGVTKKKIRFPIAQTLVKTKAGQYSMFMRKENQDSNILSQNFLGDPTCHLYGVYDGHGENGALASGFVKKALQKNLTKEIRSAGGLENENLDLPMCLRRAYATTNKELIQQTNFDVQMSGCTAVTVLTFRSEVYCANTGDSRAMVARLTQHGEWKQVELSRDHKPESPEEKARIIAAGGRVQQSLDENGEGVGIYRVWKKTQDLPGLAMTRSMGDTVGRECGIIADPEIIKHTLTEEDKIMVVASDGVWEFLTNSDVTRLLVPFYKEGKIKEAADLLVSRSHKEWLKEGESVDDITCVLLFYNEFKEAMV